MNSAVTRRWLRVRAWYTEQLPEVARTLNPSATEASLEAFDAVLQRTIGQGLPPGLREVYLENDGQDLQAAMGMFFGLTFLSVADAYEQWQTWKEIAESDPDLANETEFASAYPPGAIQPEYINLGRIPFAYDWGGNHLGIDLHPGPQGQVGQVINFGRDEEHKYVVAPSFSTFLGWFLAQLQGGNYRIVTHESEGESEHSLEILEPPNAHFLDAVSELFGPRRSTTPESLSPTEQLFALCTGKPTRIFEGQLPGAFAFLVLPEGTRVTASYLAEDPGRDGQAAVILETSLPPEVFATEALRLFEAEGWRRVEQEVSRLLFADDTVPEFWPVAEAPYFLKDGWSLVLVTGDVPLSDEPSRAILRFEYQRGIERLPSASGGLLELLPQLRLPEASQAAFQGGNWEQSHVDWSATLTTELGTAQLTEHLVQQLVAVTWEVNERLVGDQVALVTLEHKVGREHHDAWITVLKTPDASSYNVSVSATRRN